MTAVLTMRATVERDVGTSRDSYGHRVPDMQRIHQGSAALPCYVQPRTERFIADGDKVMHLARHKMWAAANADLQEGDVVTKVATLREDVVFGGRRVVRSLVRYPTHVEAVLEEYA